MKSKLALFAAVAGVFVGSAAGIARAADAPAKAPAKAPAADPYGSIADLKVAKPEDKEDVKSTPPPAGAIVLFDGKGLDAWCKRDLKVSEGGAEPKPATWKLVDGGAMQVQGGDIMTRKTFGSFKLHVEFRTPYMPDKSGQGRGNSGVYVHGRYEVQVLDSYGIPPEKYQINDCGSIYGIAVAKGGNACKAPTVWQSYDIDFTAPKFEGGKKVAAGRITVVQNGVKIHDNVEITKDNTTSGMGGDPGKPGPVMLQDHGNPVQYRNIWILETK
ncbi:MAG TPA: DUF1080 domain-containing protein [Humisphaera sp.]